MGDELPRSAAQGWSANANSLTVSTTPASEGAGVASEDQTDAECKIAIAYLNKKPSPRVARNR